MASMTAFQADGLGSNPSIRSIQSGKIMKTFKQRNPIFKSAFLRKAGCHRKPYKAIRKLEKQRGCNSMAE